MDKQIQLGCPTLGGKEHWIYLSHLISKKEYEKAVDLGNRLFKKNPNDMQICINMMDLYKKLHNNDKVIFFARRALLLGHNTGYAATRLCITLYNQKRYYAIINVCDAVLNYKYYFSSKNDKSEFYKRKVKALKKINEAFDDNTDVIINNEDFISMINNINIEKEKHYYNLKKYCNSDFFNMVIERDKEYFIYMKEHSINETFNY